MPLCLRVQGKCEKSGKFLSEVNPDDYNACVQDYPKCGKTTLERSNDMTNQRKTAGKRRRRTNKGTKKQRRARRARRTRRR